MTSDASSRAARTAFQDKLRTPAEAIGLLRSGDTVVVPTGAAEPPALLTALSDARQRLEDIRISQILPARHYGYMNEASAANVRASAYFLSGAVRPAVQGGWADFIPCHFSEIPLLIRQGLLPADVVFSLASPMDEHGYFSLGLAADYTLAAIVRARVVVLEVNPLVPFTHGSCQVHVSQISACVEDSTPLFQVGLPAIGAVQQAIGGHVADMIADGDTLQIGYGAIPDAVVMQLTDKRDLGIHTEMLGDGLLRLIEAGVVTNQRKTQHPGKSIATFALGSQALYRHMHRNPGIELHPADITNDPALAGLNDHLVAINATLQIDLLGQCGSESLGGTPYSGTGGQCDFVRAANRSKGGKAIIVLPSTAKNDTLSRIVPTLTPGTHVSTGKNEVNYVVTEYGVAQLRGKSARQRAQELIAIAHPDFRAELRDGAKRLGVM
ncbi:acetyl-CoA hydrolase/transferase family protein [Amphibiibacter pelophylacis]|uniref:Acetyl-CoA hydrolase/transferase C-terminal domain-containing protein n=1 Tax=Amphibiibacter pelophylacis TaxID=1799477 RepID=A0ACC6NZC4_9BURK